MKEHVPKGKLVLVGTPLGNRGDLSPRARAAIVGADILFCEDTRSPLRLVDEPALPPRVSCFVGNEAERSALLLGHLGAGKTVAYVSEAGLPVWSDPGQRLVEAAVAAGYEVDVVPGPTAASVALCLSGLSAEEVRFVGFLPRGGQEREERLTSLARERGTTLLYEAGNRVPALLTDLVRAMPDAEGRRAAICRELTKQHQEVLRGSVADLAGRVTTALRGEVTVVVGGTLLPREGDPAQEAARALWSVLCDPSLRPRERAKQVAAMTGHDPRETYERIRLLRGGAPES